MDPHSKLPKFGLIYSCLVEIPEVVNRMVSGVSGQQPTTTMILRKYLGRAFGIGSVNHLAPARSWRGRDSTGLYVKKL